WRLITRHVVLELLVDDQVARLPLLLDEAEGARADDLGDLLRRGRAGEARRHDEGHVGGNLAQRLEDQAVGLRQLQGEGGGIDELEALGHAPQLLANAIAPSPAPRT